MQFSLLPSWPSASLTWSSICRATTNPPLSSLGITNSFLNYSSCIAFRSVIVRFEYFDSHFYCPIFSWIWLRVDSINVFMLWCSLVTIWFLFYDEYWPFESILFQEYWRAQLESHNVSFCSFFKIGALERNVYWFHV